MDSEKNHLNELYKSSDVNRSDIFESLHIEKSESLAPIQIRLPAKKRATFQVPVLGRLGEFGRDSTRMQISAENTNKHLQSQSQRQDRNSEADPIKRSTLKFINMLKENSFFRRIPPEMTGRGYSILDDKGAHLLKRPEAKGFLGKGKIIPYLISLWEDPGLVIHPYRNFKVFWDLMQFFSMIFFFFFLPLDLLFRFEQSKIIRLGLSSFMFFDNLLGFSTAYFYHGKLITDRKKIMQEYSKYFFLDLLTQSSLIYDIFIFGDETDSMARSKYIKLIFLIQYYKFKQIYETLVDRFKIDMKFGFALDFFNLIMTSLCIMHYVACIWLSLAFFFPEERTWLDIQLIYEKSHYEKYLYSLYWAAVTMMTVGYGDVSPQNSTEVLFVIIVVIVGCGLFAYYINSVGSLLQEMKKDSMIYKFFLCFIYHIYIIKEQPQGDQSFHGEA